MTTLSELAPNYDAVLSDVWGVVHICVSAYRDAVEALRDFRKAGGRVVLITNAPRASAPIIGMLDEMNVPRDTYDAVVSSGDVTRGSIAPYMGKVIHRVGPPSIDDSLYDGLGVIRGPAEEASAVVVTDLATDADTPAMYEDRIKVWLKRKLPLIFANPDRIVEHGGRIIYCGGALADLYEAHGGCFLL